MKKKKFKLILETESNGKQNIISIDGKNITKYYNITLTNIKYNNSIPVEDTVTIKFTKPVPVVDLTPNITLRDL